MERITEFFAMGGYGLYVWGSFGVTALFMVAEPILLRQRQRRIVEQIRRRQRLAASVMVSERGGDCEGTA